MRIGLVLAVAAIAAPAAASALDLQASTAGVTTAQAGFDFGDAPDGKPARYAGKRQVRGKFPSRAASGGPRHASSGPSIGGWSGEADSRQVDRDRDDGAQVAPRSCQLSTLTVVVDASRADPSKPLYANAWFDWNRDGDWADGGTKRCGPEWGIQNQVIDPATLGDDRLALVTLRFRAGRAPKQFWWRVQLHSGATVPHMGGGGQAVATSGGETEDWFYSRPRPRREGSVTLRCAHTYSITQHGQRRLFLFLLEGVGDARLSEREQRFRLTGEKRGLILRRSDPGTRLGERRYVFAVTSLDAHERDPFLQSAAVRLELDVLINGRRREFVSRCSFGVAHAERVRPPGPPPTVLTPAFRVVINPNQPDPVAARCAARFEQSAGQKNNLVQVRCDGIDIKSTSVATGRQITFVQHSLDPGVRCETRADGRSFRCIFPPRNKGQHQSVSFGTDEPFFGTMGLHVLAGGSGEGGTAIVLHQTWAFTRDGGSQCKQSVPRTEQGQCAVLVPSG